MEDETIPTRSVGSMDGGTASPSHAPSVPIDTHRPDSTIVMRGIAGSFAREFSSASTRRLRTPFHLRLSDVTACCNEDFISSQDKSACCFTLAGSTCNKAAPSRDGGDGDSQAPFAWLEFSTRIVWGVIAQLLGGHGEVAVPTRAFTALEKRLMGLIAALASQCLADNLPGDQQITLSPIFSDAPSPDLAADEQMIVCKFEAAVGAQAGTVRLALPKQFIDSFEASISAGLETSGQYETQNEEIRSPLELSVTLDDVQITAEDLEHLSAGDLLVTDVPVDGQVQIRLAGIPKFTGQLGTWDDRRAVIIKGGL